MAQEIYLIDNGNELKNKLIQLFEKEKEYKFKKANYCNAKPNLTE